MRPILAAVVIAAVLLTATFLFIAPGQERTISTAASHPTGLRTAVAPNYGVGLEIGTSPVLPGYHDQLYYDIANFTTGTPVTTLSTITITGIYYNTAHVLFKLPGTPINVSAAAPVSSWTFLVPANATDDPAFAPVITVYANSTSKDMTQFNDVSVSVGALEITRATVCDDVSNICGALVTGDPSTVSVTAEVVPEVGISGPAPNETVKVLFYSTGSSPVPVPGVPASVTTDARGDAAVTFTPSSTIFNVPGPDHVEVEVTDSVNTSLTVTATRDWTLTNPVGTLNYQFYLNQSYYYSGEGVTALWNWAGTNSSVGTITVSNYYVRDSVTGDVIASGLVNSNVSSGSFKFTLPTTYYGDMDVEAIAHNATTYWIWEASAEVDQEIFELTPSEYYFNPGDTVTVVVTAEGPTLAGATITAFVQATNSGQTLFNSTVTSGSFQFQIPKVAPADEYHIVAWATSTADVTVATASEYIDEASGYTLWAGVSTVSSYADGSFSPGSTIQISYAITAYGTSELPTLAELFIVPGPCTIVCVTESPHALESWIVKSPSGLISFTIPSNAPNGVQVFTVVAEFTGGDGAAQVSVNVNSSPSVLNYELGAGSGLTVGWLILLILLVVVALVIVAMFRGRRGGTVVMSPASSSAPEWKEPQSGGGSAGSPPASPPSGS